MEARQGEVATPRWQHLGGDTKPSRRVRNNGERESLRGERCQAGDVERSYQRGKRFEGSSAFGKRDTTFGKWSGKQGEPHGRKQGATNLLGIAWSKPSKSGRTTRTEHVGGVASSGQRQIFGCAGSGREMQRRRRGPSMNLMRGVQ
jgi:hypothetical protein